MKSLDQILALPSGKSCVIVFGSVRAHFACRDGRWFVAPASPVPPLLGGVPVRGWTEIFPGNVIQFGKEEYIVPSPAVLSLRSGTITVHSGSEERRILNDVSVFFKKGEFVGILGGSGSGKSTLMKSLAGMNRLTEGEVILSGSSVPADQLTHDSRIAYLPQDVVIHESLTPLAALTYIVKLKKAADSPESCRKLIDRVLAETGMTEHLLTPICRLSGGQRKRIALAAELIGDPEIILLDEATSGLDPATEEEMMHLFRNLANKGKTVLCITHAPENLCLCDRVLYVMKGRVIFSGPLAKCMEFFGARSIKEIYENQSARTPEEWLAKYQTKHGKTTIPEGRIPYTAADHLSPAAAVGQLGILTLRYARLQLSDLVNCSLLFLQVPFIALMICAFRAISTAENTGGEASAVKGIIFAMMLSMLWCAGTSSVREIVKERTILTHETRFGVRTPLYLASKMIFLFWVVVIQAGLMLLIVRYGAHLAGNGLTQFLLLVLTGISGVAVGLLVSACSKNSERAMTLLPIILIAQAIFAGVLFTLSGLTLFAAKIAVPAYWSLQGLIATFSQELQEAGPGGKLILGYGVPFAAAAFILVMMSAIPLILTDSKLAGVRFSSGPVFRLTAVAFCFAAILAVGLSCHEKIVADPTEDWPEFIYEEVPIPPSSESLNRRISLNTGQLSSYYGDYLNGSEEGLLKAVNLLKNLEIHDRAVYKSDDRAFVRIKEIVETLRGDVPENAEICPKTESLRVRVEKDTEALTMYYDSFMDEADPNGLRTAFNYLKNIEAKDPAVFEYMDPKDLKFQTIREKVEKAKKLLDDAYAGIRDDIQNYDGGAANRTDRLKNAKEKLEELTDRYPVLKMNGTVESLGKQVRDRYRDIAVDEAEKNLEKVLDESRSEEFIDLEAKTENLELKKPEIDEIETKRKTPEQVREEKEQLKEKTRGNAFNLFRNQVADLNDKLDEGYDEIDEKIAELHKKLDELAKEYPDTKDSPRVRSMKEEIEFERTRLRLVLTLRTYEKSQVPEVLEKARTFLEDWRVPDTDKRDELQKRLAEQQNLVKSLAESLENAERSRSEKFRAEYKRLDGQLDRAQELRGSDLDGLQEQIKTETELSDYLDLQERNMEIGEIQTAPPQGTDAGERIVLEVRGVSFPFRWCPAGTYEMGSPEGEFNRGTDERQHSVTLTRGFWILETEVTQKMYAVITETTPPSYQILTNAKYAQELGYHLVKGGASKKTAEHYVRNLRTDDVPVESVTYRQALDFCAKLNSFFTTGETGAGKFTLPTEAQWEYACRAGVAEPFSLNHLKMEAGDQKISAAGVTLKLREYGAVPVSSSEIQDNPWGITGMHGNVSEWCRDLYADYTSEPQTDPVIQKGSDYAVRGGSWKSGESSCRSAARSHKPASAREQTIGFRVIFEPGER